jgi:hypothetical protein
MNWDDIQSALIGAWGNVAGTQLYFAIDLAAVVGITGFVTWIALMLRYGALIANLRKRLAAAEKRNVDFERQFATKTPADVAARFRQMEEHIATLPPRTLSDEQKRRLAQAANPPPSASYLAIVHDSMSPEVIRFAQDFVDAFRHATGWNLVEEAYPIPPETNGRGISVGLANRDSPTPTESLVLQALADADVPFETKPRVNRGADVEIVVSSR